MSRSLRTIVILAAVAVAGLVALTWLAGRYREMAKPAASADTDDPAARDVDGFVATRRALKAYLEANPDVVSEALARMKEKHPPGYTAVVPTLGLGAFYEILMVRRQALQTSGLSHERYVEVRTAWRDSRSGKTVADARLRDALAARAADLATAELGEWEALDDITPK